MLPWNLSLRACFADINDSQGSVAKYARCSGIFNFHLTANLSRNFPLSFFKLVKIWQNYDHEYMAPLFWAHPVNRIAACCPLLSHYKTTGMFKYFPAKYPFPWGYTGRRLVHGSLSSCEFGPKTASWSAQPFFSALAVDIIDIGRYFFNLFYTSMW